MKYKYLLLVAVIFFHNIINGQTQDSINENFKIFEIKLVPLTSEIEIPEITKKEHIIDSNDFVINIVSKRIIIKYKNKTTNFVTIKKLNEYLKEKKINKIMADIYLQIEKKTDQNKTLKIIETLRLNGITEFSMETKK